VEGETGREGAEVRGPGQDLGPSLGTGQDPDQAGAGGLQAIGQFLGRGRGRGTGTEERGSEKRDGDGRQHLLSCSC